MAANDVVRLRTKATLLGSRVEFGVHLRYVTASANAQDLLDDWAASIVPLVVDAASSDTNWYEVQVSDTNPLGAESVAINLPQPNPGHAVGDSLPPQNAVVVSLRSGTKGGRRRGRFYFPGITEQSQANGVFAGLQLASVQELADGILGRYGPSGTNAEYRLVVYSPEILTFPEPKPKKPRPGRIISQVTNVLVDTTVRTQRRRGIGIGQ
jgi:hypothetical protein